jgi:hypothetical protein
LSFSLGNHVWAILECPHNGQLQLVTRRLIDELRQPFHAVGRVRIVLHKSLVVDVLRRKVYIPGADAVKYRQNFLDVGFRHCLISFSQVDWGPSAVMALRPYVGPQRVRRSWLPATILKAQPFAFEASASAARARLSTHSW